jgi:hypothetical protein
MRSNFLAVLWKEGKERTEMKERTETKERKEGSRMDNGWARKEGRNAG